MGKELKAVLIHVGAGTVKEVTLDGSLDGYYKALGCDCITSVEYDEDHDLIVDDEGLLKDPTLFFQVGDDRNRRYAGNGLIVRNDGEGDWVSHKLKVSDVKKSIKFFGLVRVGREVIEIELK